MLERKGGFDFDQARTGFEAVRKLVEVAVPEQPSKEDRHAFRQAVREMHLTGATRGQIARALKEGTRRVDNTLRYVRERRRDR
jgi:hypothetical protein